MRSLCERTQPSATATRNRLALMLGEQPLHMGIKAALDLGFKMRGEVVDHVLHDGLGRGAQLSVQMHQQGVGSFLLS